MTTFDVMLGLAPLFKRSSTILMLPRSEAHIRAVHPCCEHFFNHQKVECIKFKLLNVNKKRRKFQSDFCTIYYYDIGFIPSTLSDSLASIDVVISPSFWRICSTVLRSSFLTASMRSYYVHQTCLSVKIKYLILFLLTIATRSCPKRDILKLWYRLDKPWIVSFTCKDDY